MVITDNGDLKPLSWVKEIEGGPGAHSNALPCSNCSCEIYTATLPTIKMAFSAMCQMAIRMGRDK